MNTAAWSATRLAPAALAATALLLAGAAPARGEASARPERKPYEFYKLIETRNIFAPPGSAAATAASSAAAAATGAAVRSPVLTGIVLDTRTNTYKGLIETPGQPDPLFVGEGDACSLGRVLRVSLDRIVVQTDGGEVEIPVGCTVAPGGTVVETSAASAPLDDAKTQDAIERLKSKHGRRADGTAVEEPKGAEPAAPVVDEKHRSILDMLKLRRKRPDEGAKKN
jgi:hypothetical protein